MQIPLAQVLEVATGAGGLFQKLMGKDGGSGFEAKLNSALKGGEKGAPSQVEKILKKLGAGTSEAEQVLASGAGAVLFQTLIALNQAGLSASDLKSLLAGDGAKLSDEGLTALLANLGYTEEQVGAIMADSSQKQKLGAALSAKVGELLTQHSAATGKSLTELKSQLNEAMDSFDSQAEQIMAEFSELGLDLKSAVAEPLTGLARLVSQILGEQPAAPLQQGVAQVAQAAQAGAVLGPDARANAAGETKPGLAKAAAAKAEQLIKTATQEVGVQADELKQLMVASTPEERAVAVSAVTNQVKGYLESQQGKPLEPEVRNSLQLIKSGMSEAEFAPIEQALQAFSGVQLKEVASPLTAQVINAAGQQLAPEAGSEQQFGSVLDQLKQSFASELKAPPSSLSLELNPPMLGRVDVSVSLVDGNLSASFKADQVVTRDMLANNLESLKETLKEQGFNVNQVNVSLDFGRERRDDLAFAFAQQQQREGQNASRAARMQNRQAAQEAPEAYAINPSVSYAPGQLSLFA